jgi:hypothetical protein
MLQVQRLSEGTAVSLEVRGPAAWMEEASQGTCLQQ